MRTLRRYSLLTFAVACTHLIFGAIVRISGSGMGCGHHWPKCYGYWVPPFSRPDLVVEISHRYLALLLLVSLAALVTAAFRRRTEVGVGGEGGVLRSSSLATALWFCEALLGAITVKLGNAPFATLAHWTVAMSLVATVVATVIRTGAFGGDVARSTAASPRTQRASFAAGGMALLTVIMGGLTAKYPGAAVACRSFPLCGPNPDVVAGAVHIQLTHRVLAILLILHIAFGMVLPMRRRGEAPVFRRVALVALSLGVLQLLVAGAMIGMRLPPVLRSLHEATGVSIWIATFALAYLARISGDSMGVVSRARTNGPVTAGAAVLVPNGASASRAAEDVDRWRPASAEANDPWQNRGKLRPGAQP